MSLTNEYSQKYEYTFEIVRDRFGGVDIETITGITKERALKGWRLITVFTNELGKNALSVGGVGINASVDQTILVFEREIKQKYESIFYTEAPIMDSNIISPFVPKTATFFDMNDSVYVTLKVFCRRDFELNGLQGNLVIRNIFGDEIIVEDICFFSFEKKQDGYFVSSPFPITLPNKISYGISNAGLAITRYIGNNSLEILQDTATFSIVEAQASKADSFDVDAFFVEVESMHAAADIYTYVQQLNNKHPSILSDEIVQKIENIKRMERSYGNMKNSALNALNTYFDNLGIRT